MIRKLDEASSELSKLIGDIEVSKLQFLKINNDKYWVDEALNTLDKIEEVREFLITLHGEL